MYFDRFSIMAKSSQSNQEQYSLCCSSPCFCISLCTHHRPLQCFSTYFRKSEEIGALRPKFPDCYFFLLWSNMLLNIIIKPFNLLTLSWRRPLPYRASPLIFSANQWTGFYMITASVMKELNTIQLTRTKTLINNLLINFEF